MFNNGKSVPNDICNGHYATATKLQLQLHLNYNYI